MDANKANQTAPGAGGADYYTRKNITSLIAIDRQHPFPAQLNGKNLKRSVVRDCMLRSNTFLVWLGKNRSTQKCLLPAAL
jgi:hypothetical protein